MSKEYDIVLNTETKEELLWLLQILDKNGILYTVRDKSIVQIHNLCGGL